MPGWVLSISALLPLAFLSVGVVWLGDQGRPTRLKATDIQASRPALLACETDMRRNHPQEEPFQLSLGEYDTVFREVGAETVRWTLSGTLTRSGDVDGYFFDCQLEQRGGILRVTFSHASLWYTPPPS